MISAGDPASREATSAERRRVGVVVRWVAGMVLLVGAALSLIGGITGRGWSSAVLASAFLILFTGLGGMPWSGGFVTQPIPALFCGLAGCAVGVVYIVGVFGGSERAAIGGLLVLTGVIVVTGAIATLTSRRCAGGTQP